MTVGVLLLTHEGLGTALLAAAMRVLGAPLRDGTPDFAKHLERPLDASGTFALADVRSGSYRLLLAPPASRWLGTSGSVIQESGGSWCYQEGGGLPNSLFLADVLIAPGEDLELDFGPGAEAWPGHLEVEILVDGTPVTSWGVKLREEHDDSWCDLQFGTDSSGRGSTTLFAGRWLVEIEDPLTGWKHSFPDPLVIQPAQLTRQVLAVERP